MSGVHRKAVICEGEQKDEAGNCIRASQQDEARHTRVGAQWSK